MKPAENFVKKQHVSRVERVAVALLA
jgi:hypothetical protein